MLSDRQLEALLDVFRQRMQGVTEDYLKRMGAHLKEIGNLTAADINRIVQLKRLNYNIEQIKREIAAAANQSAEDIERVFEAVAQSDMRFAAAVFAQDHTPSVKDNKPLERILKAQAKITQQEMKNLSQTTLLSDSYREAVDVAVQAVQSGVTDYSSAIRNALKTAAQDGLRVQYPNSGISRRLDSAIRMNVLDGVRAINQDVMRQVGKEFDADGIELSAHAICAEDHLPYQGTQMPVKEFERLQNRLDRPFGMWNCRHSWHPILLGVSPPRYTPEELEEFKRNSREEITIDGRTKTRYEWTQEQRRIETAVRYQKDIAIAAKASGDDYLRRETQRNINGLTSYYAKISNAAGLYQETERMAVSGFRKVKTAEELKKRDKEGISIEIDELTPCLRKVSTGELVETNFSIISPTHKSFSKWLFDWTQPEKKGYTVYALKAKGSNAIQGLIAMKEERGYIDVDLVESAPQNNPYNKVYFSGQKEYNGVGGHLFAEACRQSFEKGNDGWVGFTAKTNLIEHYKKEFQAVPIYEGSQRMEIRTDGAQHLIDVYYGGKV